jgi:opacity protein-like surface antigen
MGPLMAAAADDVYHLEITPFAGYRLGGSFDAEDNATGVDVDVDIDDHASYGLIVNWPAAFNTEYEVFLSRQSTSLDTNAGLFLPGEPVLDDLDISYLQVGGTYLFEGDRAWPFIVATVGASRFEPDSSEFDSETFFSFGIGGGYKIAPSSRIGLRLEGRLLGSYLGGDSAVFCRSDEVSSGCLIAVSGDMVWQWEMSAGLRVRF